jgi:hypothetical protein
VILVDHAVGYGARRGQPIVEGVRILLAAVGSRGDVQPMLALALRLRERGHTIQFCAPPNFEAWIAGHSLPFRGLGRDFQAFLNQIAQPRAPPPGAVARAQRVPPPRPRRPCDTGFREVGRFDVPMDQADIVRFRQCPKGPSGAIGSPNQQAAVHQRTYGAQPRQGDFRKSWAFTRRWSCSSALGADRRDRSSSRLDLEALPPTDRRSTGQIRARLP